MVRARRFAHQEFKAASSARGGGIERASPAIFNAGTARLRLRGARGGGGTAAGVLQLYESLCGLVIPPGWIGWGLAFLRLLDTIQPSVTLDARKHRFPVAKI